MLAGTVYFYDREGSLIETMDLYDYEGMSKEEFLEYVHKIKASKVEIGSISNNHQRKEHIEEIYNSKLNETI